MKKKAREHEAAAEAREEAREPSGASKHKKHKGGAKAYGEHHHAKKDTGTIGVIGREHGHHHGHSKHKHHKEAHHGHHDEGHHDHRSGHDVSGYSEHKGKHAHGSGDVGGTPENQAISGGPLINSNMVAYPDGEGHADTHAHHSHHEANKAYGMHQGSSPKGYGSDAEGGSSHGGEGMESNAEYC